MGLQEFPVCLWNFIFSEGSQTIWSYTCIEGEQPLIRNGLMRLLGSTCTTMDIYFGNLRMEERCLEFRNRALRYEKPFSKWRTQFLHADTCSSRKPCEQLISKYKRNGSSHTKISIEKDCISFKLIS